MMSKLPGALDIFSKFSISDREKNYAKDTSKLSSKKFLKKTLLKKICDDEKQNKKKFQKVLQCKDIENFSTLSQTNTACAMRAIQFERSSFYIVILKIMF